jgi:glucose/arabinose dehydrogenase/plastocyanin
MKQRLVGLVGAVLVLSAVTALPGRAANTTTITTAAFTFVPPVVSIAKGDQAQLANPDIAPHDVTSDTPGLFHSAAVQPGGAPALVAGVESLPAGTYAFHCSFHPFMHGTLNVTEGTPVPPLPVPVVQGVGVAATPTSITTFDGSLYVASYGTGSVSTLAILPGGLLGPAQPYASGFTNPLGIEFDKATGVLYVADSHAVGSATVGRVWAVEPGGATKTEVIDGLPNGRHNTNGMAVHNGQLFIANGSSTDNGNPDSPGGPAEVPNRSGALLSVPVGARGLNSDSPEVTVEATGMRNIYDVMFRSGTDEAWIPMNGPDTFDPYGQDLLLKADTAGATVDFGFPACIYGPGGVGDWKQNPAVTAQCTGAQKLPEQLLGLHVSADGLAFDVSGKYVYVALFGNFFGNEVVGHKVVRVPVDANGVAGAPQDVIVGGAPLDVTATSDGIYVADFASGQITLVKPLA